MSKSNFEPVCTEIKMDFDDLNSDDSGVPDELL